MSQAPSLFAPMQPETGNEASSTDSTSHNLVDLMYDGFYMIVLLNKRNAPKDINAFSQSILLFLEQFEKAARRQNFSAQDIYDAKYALCATIDEVVLSSQMQIRDDWERRPLQLKLFGDQLAGEHFFDHLQTARDGGAERIQALEVFYMCLLLGFKGRYLLEGPEKLKYLTRQLGEQIAHIKGKAASFAPHWAAPDSITHTIRRDVPVWIIFSVAALLALIAYIGLDWHAAKDVEDTLSPFRHIVQLAPRAPTLTITLP